LPNIKLSNISSEEDEEEETKIILSSQKPRDPSFTSVEVK